MCLNEIAELQFNTLKEKKKGFLNELEMFENCFINLSMDRDKAIAEANKYKAICEVLAAHVAGKCPPSIANTMCPDFDNCCDCWLKWAEQPVESRG